MQGGRAILLENYSGTLDGSGNALFAHGKGATFLKKVIAVHGSAKTVGGAWVPLTATYVDGTNVSLTGTGAYAGQPYNATIVVGDIANVGW